MESLPDKCNRCGGKLAPGQAIPPALVETDPKHEGHATTITQGAWQNIAPTIPVLKCQSCGHSFTFPKS